MRRLLKLGLIVLAIVALLLAGAAVAPRLIDVEAYKAPLTEAVRQATGRELVIEGPLKLTLLPVPRISARQVHFANATGAKGAQMVNVRWVGASPSWWALLQGRIEVGTLILYRPTLVLETDADGVPNWEFKPGASSRQEPGASAEGMHLAVGRLRIIDGTVSYTDPQNGKTIKAEQVQATASVGSLDGPFSIEGTGTVNDVPLSLGLEVSGRNAQDLHDVRLSLQVESGRLAFDGRASAIAPDAAVTGHLSVSTGILTDFIAAVVGATGTPPPVFGAPVVGSFSFEGGVEISPDKLALNDFKVVLGSDSAAGSVALTHGPKPALEGKLALPELDLDKWVALLSQPGIFLPKPAAPAGGAATPSAFPPQVTVDLDLGVERAIFRQRPIQGLALAMQVRAGVVTVPRVKATLPGGMTVDASTTPDGSGKAAGTFRLAGDNLRETLGWLGIDTGGVPPDKLRSLSVDGKLTVAPGSLAVSDASIALDGQSARGGATLAFGSAVAVSATLDIDRFDLDGYLPTGTSAAPAATADASTASPAASTAKASDAAAPRFQVKSKIANLVYRGEMMRNVDGDVAIQGDLLTINGLNIGDLLGAKINMKGTVAGFATQPRFDLSFNATMPDTEKLLGFVGLPKLTNGSVGASTASGGVSGTLAAATLRNVAVSTQGVTVNASGTVTLAPTISYDLSAFSLQASDAGRLLSVATGRPPTAIGAVATNGALKGTDKRVTFSGQLDALGTQMQGTLDAALGGRPSITVKLRIPGTVDVDRWLGVAPDGPPAAFADAGVSTAKPFDLTALKSFDAALSLETSATQVASIRVDYADLEATLRNGLFTLSRLTGQFYGGAVDFSGTINASGNTVAVDLSGSVQGIYFGQMLRGTVGSNSFGDPNLMLAMDGKLSATGIRLTGQGNSPEEIRNNLSGAASLSGYVFPQVTKGSIEFARFATGVGSLFSSEMAFNSAMLQGFVNRQNPIQGQLSLGGGAVTFQSPTIAGANTTATLKGSTNLVTATTDTVVNINTGNDRTAADFVIKVTGPLAAPVVTTGRGGGN